MAEVDIVHATPAHAAHVAAHMRDADRAEVWATARLTPAEALAGSIRSTPAPLAGLVDGVPLCVFGIAPRGLLSGEGVPWLLGTDDIRRHRRQFLPESRLVLGVIARGFDLLVNHVDARNSLSIRWLSWLGFQIHPAEPFGVDRLPFHRFTMEGTGHV